MILVCGIPSEGSLAMALAEIERLGLPHLVFNQRRFAEFELDFELVRESAEGALRVGEVEYALGELSGVYTRLMDDRLLPELREEPPESALRASCRALHEALASWCEIAPARVVNRSRPQGSNSSKPFQSQLIAAHGFSVPETLVTNDPEVAREFLAVHPRAIYKSISGVRSIVQPFDSDADERLELIRWCPVQFQAFVPGADVRAHVVDRQVFATAVRSDATDYRYATSQVNESAELSATELPEEVTRRCVELAGALELPFAGIDLRVTPDGEVFCFEVNPSPAFSYYESATGQPIARALVRYLAGD